MRQASLLLLSLIFCLPVWGQVRQISSAPQNDILYSTTTQAGTPAATTEADLITWTLPANKLATDGDTIYIRAEGTLAANTNSKTVRLHFGTVDVTLQGGLAMTSVANGGRGWKVEVWITRLSATSQIISCDWGLSDASGRHGVFNAATADLTGEVAIRLTGQSAGGTENDIVARRMVIKRSD